MCSEAPDTTIAQQAAVQNAALGKEALDWYKQTYNDGAADRASASDMAREQAGIQNDTSKLALEAAQKANDRYNTIYAPVEDKIVADAQSYDTPERREAAARSAVADQEIALNNQRTQTNQMLERRGITLSSGKGLALATQFDLGAAKNKAGAANTARERVESVGAAKMMDAAGLGRGVVGTQATQAQIGLQAGNSAVGNATAPSTIAQQAGSAVGQGYSTAIGANTSAANINLGIGSAQAGVDASNGQQMAAGASAAASIAIAI